mmetsp:Transcript_3589/g.9974  ORF Transcript_3589/g.9974 Transcript_3589/m.9974 type:complete len:296 (-) Transcript_3589:1270-2157(-)
MSSINRIAISNLILDSTEENSTPGAEATRSRNYTHNLLREEPAPYYETTSCAARKRSRSSTERASARSSAQRSRSTHSEDNKEIDRDDEAAELAHVERQGSLQQSHVRWSADEDELLLRLVERYGTKRWAMIATEHFAGQRKPDQLRTRYANVLNPNRDVKSWTTEEDAILLSGHDELGNQWQAIALRLDGRVANDVKNRYRGLQREARRKERQRLRRNEADKEPSRSIAAGADSARVGDEGRSDNSNGAGEANVDRKVQQLDRRPNEDDNDRMLQNREISNIQSDKGSLKFILS